MDLDELTDDLAAEVEAYTRGAPVPPEDMDALAHHVVTWLHDRHLIKDDPAPESLFILSDAIDPMPPAVYVSLVGAKAAARTRTAKRRRIAVPPGDDWSEYASASGPHYRWRHVIGGALVADYLIETITVQ